MKISFAFLFLSLFVYIPFVDAEETYTFNTVTVNPSVRFNNENWFTTPHPQVHSFVQLQNGNFQGMTATGIPFSQFEIENSGDVRIDRFEIEDHYHYIINGEIAYTTQELSTKLAEIQAPR